MYNLKSLKLGYKVTVLDFQKWILFMSYTHTSAKQLIGNVIQWNTHGFNPVESLIHLAQAPCNSEVVVREHYFGHVVLTQRNGIWYVTDIKTIG